MLDTKSRLVLSVLAKETKNGNYKIFELPDIIMSLPKHYRMDESAIKHILIHLERQDIISIKYEDDEKYCLAVLPFGFEILETEKPKYYREIKDKKNNNNNFLIGFFSAFLGTSAGFAIFYLIFKFLVK